MPYGRYTDADGKEHVYHVKLAGRPKTCHYCGFLSTKLCDATLSNGRTCDRQLCDRHAHVAGPNVDYCGDHAHVAGEQRQLGL